MATPQPLNLPPEDAIEFFESKGMHFGFDWRDTAQQYHARSFTVAKAMELNLLSDVRTAVSRALANGESFGTFRRQLEPILRKRGWWGRREMRDPVTGAVRVVQLGSAHRLRIIFDTNMRTAYAHGQWQRIQRAKESAPYLSYNAVMDSRTRPEHAAWDGIILPVDHPFWKTHFPPNGWRCRCSVIQLSEAGLERRGLSITENPPTATRPWRNRRSGVTTDVPVGIDPGFARNVGDLPGGLLADTIENATVPSLIRAPTMQGAMMWQAVMNLPHMAKAWNEQFSSWVDAVIRGDRGVPHEIVGGALHPDHLAAVSTLIGAKKTDELSAAIMVERGMLLHMRRDSKVERGAAVSEEDIKRIPEILRNPRAVVLHRAERTNRSAVLYVLDQTYGDGRLGKIVVRVDLRRKVRIPQGSRKHINANWIVTAGLVESMNLKAPDHQLIAGSLD